jgi:filamentous hemagglutinin family protein
MTTNEMRQTARNGRISLSPRRLSAAVALTLLPAAAYALPTGEQVVAGQAQFNRGANTLTIQQQTPNAIVNWNGFSISGSEAVRFQQPSASSVILNRVVGNNPSEILGRLTANGKLFLVNPNGVLFGAGSSVNVGSLVASTLDIRNEDFLAGRFQFQGAGGSVLNQGFISADDRGTVALLGGKVSNDGVVTAKLGSAILAAGGKITLDFAGDGLTRVNVSETALNAQVENHNAVLVDGGQAVLTAHAAEALSQTVVNQSGLVRANTLAERNGRIILDGGVSGVTLVSGTQDVSGLQPGQTGGEMHVLGQHVGLVGNATLDARGHSGGGTILVGGDYQGKNVDVRNATAAFVGPDAVIRVDATTNGNGGKAIVWGNEATRAHGTMTARGGSQGGDGGFIETSAAFLDTAGIRIDASAPFGKAGEWLLDPADIVIASSTSFGVTPGPNFTSTSSSAMVGASDIQNALNIGTSVSVSTNGTLDPNADESIYVTANIAKTAGGDAKLALNAHHSIIVDPGIVISSSSGKLDVDFNADLDNLNGGAILVRSNAQVLSNGGDVRFYGANNPATGRASGVITPLTEGAVAGIEIATGAVIDTRVGQTSGAPSGNILLRGQGMEEVIVSGGAISTPTAGVRLDQVSLLASTGTISIDGIGGRGGIGVYANDGVISSESGKVGIFGRGPGFPGSSPTPIGVNMASLTITTSNGGSIDIRGRGEPSVSSEFGVINAIGVDSDDAVISTIGSPGSIFISGESVGSDFGIRMNGGTQIGGPSTTGHIMLRAANAGGADMINLAGTIQSSGVVNLRPGGVTPFGTLSELFTATIDLFIATTNFSLNTNELASLQNGFQTIAIGSKAHSGEIVVWNDSSLPSFADNLSLLNGASNSNGIRIDGPLLNPGNLVTLSTGGAVRQTAPIQASRLLLHGTQPESHFQLVDTGNNVGTLATLFELPKSTAHPDFGDVNYINSTGLTIGPLTGAWLDLTSNFPVPISASGSSSTGGDLFVRVLSGDLALKHDVRTLGSDITFVIAGVFLNPTSRVLLPGGSGVWRIFADTFIGEDRGGLVPTSPQPNFYNCTFGGSCGVTAPTTGNHFIYSVQPSLTISAEDASRLLGGQNPLFTFNVVGLVNGDTVADALAGGFTTTAGRTSPSGSYILDATFTSPTGYTFTSSSATLTVLPVAEPTTPDVARDAPMDSGSAVSKNLIAPGMCVSTGSLGAEASPSGGYDSLALEWSRVRSKSSVSSCIDLGQRNGCQDF